MREGWWLFKERALVLKVVGPPAENLVDETQDKLLLFSSVPLVAGEDAFPGWLDPDVWDQLAAVGALARLADLGADWLLCADCHATPSMKEASRVSGQLAKCPECGGIDFHGHFPAQAEGVFVNAQIAVMQAPEPPPLFVVPHETGEA